MDPLAPESSGDLLHPNMPQALHDALSAVRSRGAYYGGAPVAPGPAVEMPRMPAEPPAIGWNSIEPLLGRGPAPPAVNENIPLGLNVLKSGVDPRGSVLAKLIANRDFVPTIVNGRMYFRSLTPAENQLMARIGWARAPGVEHEQEISSDPLTMRRAWERNIRHWHELAQPR